MKRINLLLFLASVLLVSSLSCTKDIIDTTGNLYGTITDSRTFEPLPGVSISLSPLGKTTTTGVDGKYEFRDIESQQYTVAAAKTGYISDRKTAFVQVGEGTTLDFQLTPATGSLSCAPNMLDFGNDVTNLTFEISNPGIAALKWQLAENASWLSCNPTSGTTNPSEKSSVVVTVDRTGLERGSYSQSIAVSSEGGGSAIINVKMSVQGITVSFSPEQLDFGSITNSMPFTLTNTGTGNITYALTPSNTWISLSKQSGTFSKTDNVTVSVNRSGLAVGDYDGYLTLVVAENQETIPVRMNIPSKEKPVVSTIRFDEVSYNSATVYGNIVKVGSSAVTRHGFCWSTAPTPIVETASICNLGDAEIARDFSYNLLNLEASTTYYVRAYAENVEGISYGEQLTFTTKGTPKLATVSTGASSNVTDVSASVAGTVENLGNVDKILQFGHVWNRSGSPTVKDSRTELGMSDRTLSFNSALMELLPSTVYYVRAYATNSVGTSYGQEITFRTSSSNTINMEGYGDDNKWIP